MQFYTYINNGEFEKEHRFVWQQQPENPAPQPQESDEGPKNKNEGLKKTPEQKEALEKAKEAQQEKLVQDPNTIDQTAREAMNLASNAESSEWNKTGEKLAAVAQESDEQVQQDVQNFRLHMEIPKKKEGATTNPEPTETAIDSSAVADAAEAAAREGEGAEDVGAKQPGPDENLYPGLEQDEASFMEQQGTTKDSGPQEKEGGVEPPENVEKPRTKGEQLQQQIEEAKEKYEKASKGGDKSEMLAAALEYFGTMLQYVRLSFGINGSLNDPIEEKEAQTTKEATKSIEDLNKGMQSIREHLQKQTDSPLADLLNDASYTMSESGNVHLQLTRESAEAAIQKCKEHPQFEVISLHNGVGIRNKETGAAISIGKHGNEYTLDSIANLNLVAKVEGTKEVNPEKQEKTEKEPDQERLNNIQRNLDNVLSDNVTSKEVDAKAVVRNGIWAEPDGSGKYVVQVALGMVNGEVSAKVMEALNDPGVFRHQDRLANRISTEPMTIDELEAFASRLKARLA